MSSGARPLTTTGADTGADIGMSRSDVDVYLDVVASFAAHCDDVLFGAGTADATATGPDGDLSALPSLLAEAGSMGLLADPAAGPDGDDYGIWGGSALYDGPLLSLSTLEVLAGTCAGLAAAIHAQGIGRVAMGRLAGTDPSIRPGATVAAVFVPDAGVVMDVRTRTDAVSSTVDDAGGGVLRGRSGAVWVSDRPQILSIAAWTGSEWMVVIVPTASEGVSVIDVSGRVGLRATLQVVVDLDDVTFDSRAVVARGDQAADLIDLVTALDWLGLAAIGLGTTRAALEQATDYAINRIQGGSPIIDHAAVRMLLGQASHDVAVLGSLVRNTPRGPVPSTSIPDLLSAALTARVGVAEHAFRAVSNCVQVLGGYGYMDDYGISKRLRDISALRSRHGNREQLLLTRAQLDLSDVDGSNGMTTPRGPHR